MKSKLFGWNTVFGFTLKQTLKGKSFLLSTIILAVLCFASVPFMASSDSDSSNFGDSLVNVDIEKAYYYDSLGIAGEDLREMLIKAGEKSGIKNNYDEMEFICLNDDISAGDANNLDKDKIKDAYCEMDDCDDSVLVIFGTNDAAYEIECVRSENSNIGSMDMDIFEGDLYSFVQDSIYKIAGITQEQIDMIMTQDEIVSISISDGKIEDEEDNSDNFMAGTSTGMGIFMLMVFILAIGGEAASTSMITEKGSRAIEYVLTSIKPMALILGKILANIVAQLFQVAIFILCVGSSAYLFTRGSTKMTTVEKLAQSFGVAGMADSISPGKIIIALLVIAGGIVFYVTIASLIGSTASRMEELTHTNMIYSVLLVVGAYTAMVLTMPGMNISDAAKNFILIFPLSSPFVTPTFVIMGDCSIKVGIASVIAMIVAIVLLMLLVSKVFEAIIFFNGSKITFAHILEFAGLKKVKVKQSNENKEESEGSDNE